MKRTIASLSAGLLLAGCESFTFESNLDPRNFSEYYRPSSVDVVTDAELEGKKYVVLGQVSGLACQIKPTDYIATEADARTDARLKAVNLKANAIKFGRCVHLSDTPACTTSVTCYGEALDIKDND